MEARGSMTLTCIQKAFVQLAVAVRWPRYSVSLAVYESHGITYDPMFTIGDRVSCHVGVLLLMFLTALVKFDL